MRMWMLPPKMLCNKHLLGEHGEIHKFRHTFVKQYKIDKRISPVVQIEPLAMKKRHDELAEEMALRGMNHESPYDMPNISYLSEEQRFAKADIRHNFHDLIQRCDDCAKRIHGDIALPWHFTWGFNQGHDNCYTVIHGTYSSARDEMVRRWGDKWGFQYALPELAGVERFNLRRI